MEHMHFQETDAWAAIEQAIVRAKDTGKFMVCVWTPREDGQVDMLTRTTWQFPITAMPRCVDVLYQSVNEELRPKPQPLPTAPFAASISSDVQTNPLPEARFGRDDDDRENL